MPAAPMSAVEAMTPAFARAKRQLFQPFRFWRWSRLALISLLAGEMGTGGNWGNSGSWRVPEHSGRNDFLQMAPPSWQQFQEYLPVIVAAAISLFILLAIFIYIGSVFRFLLFDAVLSERVRIREGWRRWQAHGGRLFLWNITYGVVMLLLLWFLIVLPLLYAWSHGMFSRGSEQWGTVIGVGLLLLFVVGIVLLAALLVTTLTKDFVVPLMALEELGAVEAWRRLLPMLRAEKGAYAGYIGMKVVAAFASAILFGILTALVFLLALIPLVILGVVVGVMVSAAGLTWNPLTIVLAVVGGAVLLFGLFWLMALVSVPAVVFFQSYTLYFFGARYARLGERMAPPAPPIAAPAPAPA